MFTFKTCGSLPEYGAGGCVVFVEGRVMWGGGLGVYSFDGVYSGWVRLADDKVGSTLAVYGGELVSVGGLKDIGVCSKEVKVLRGRRWTSMPEMLVGCMRSCVVSVSGGVLLVMGGRGNWCRLSDGYRPLNDDQIFDGRVWHIGPSLPQRCYGMSAAVHRDLVFVVGGEGMERAAWSANITDLVSHCMNIV